MCTLCLKCIVSIQDIEYTILSSFGKPYKYNTADCATRAVLVANFQESQWLVGPSCVQQTAAESENLSFPSVSPDDDKEIRPTVRVLKSDIGSSSSLGSRRFEKLSPWKTLAEAIVF